MNDLKEIEKIVGYTFTDTRLAEIAFTHSSYANERGGESNERMEFLGDAVLDFLVSEQLYHGDGDEGDMTVRRAELVSKGPLAQAVEKMDLLRFTRFGRGAAAEDPSEKLKSNLFEAVLAAIYLDGGIAAARKFVLRRLPCEAKNNVDYKTRLQETLQSDAPELRYADRQLSSSPPCFSSRAELGGKVLGTGEGHSKKEAQQKAAADALRVLESESARR